MTTSLWSLVNKCLETSFLLLQKRKFCPILKNILAMTHEVFKGVFSKFFRSFWKSHWQPFNSFRCLILPKSLGFHPQFFHPVVFCRKVGDFSSFTPPLNLPDSGTCILSCPAVAPRANPVLLLYFEKGRQGCLHFMLA